MLELFNAVPASWVHVFFGLFARHFVLASEVFLVAAIVRIGLGDSLGLAWIFWEAGLRKQFVAGIGLAMFLTSTFLCGYLRDEPELSPPHTTLTFYLLCCTLGTWVLTAVLGLAGTVRSLTDEGESARRWPLWAGVLFGQGLGLLCGRGMDSSVFSGSARSLQNWMPPLISVGGTFGGYHAIAACFAATLIAGLAVLALRDGVATHAQPGLAFCAVASLLGIAQSFLASRGWNAIEVVGLLVGLLLGAGAPKYKIRVPELVHRYSRGRLVHLAEYPVGSCRSQLNGRPANWGEAGRRPVVLVCAEGNDGRAAAWTAAVLSELEDAIPGFPYHVRIVSGAAGGLVGAAYYVATLRPPVSDRNAREAGWHHTVSAADFRKNVRGDCFSMMAERTAALDVPLAFLPFPNTRHRGLALQRAWCEHMPELKRLTFAKLRKGENEGWLPSLVFSPTLVEDRRPLLISNVDFSETSAGLLGAPFALEFARLFPEELPQLPVLTAARLSSALPFVSPAEVLPVIPRRRIAAAGVRDRSGLDVATRWLETLLEGDGHQWLRQNVSGVALIRIGCFGRSSADLDSKDPDLFRGFEELTSPVSALLASDRLSQRAEQEHRLQLVGRRLNEAIGKEEGFRVSSFDLSGRPTAVWRVGESDARIIDAAAADLKQGAVLAGLRRWWAAQLPSSESLPQPDSHSTPIRSLGARSL